MEILYISIIIILILLIVSRTELFDLHFNFETDENQRMKLYDECRYKALGTDNREDWELGECSVAIQTVPYAKNVLELGGGSGKVSHMINKILQKRGLGSKHIVVEPTIDNSFGSGFLIENRNNFNDEYTIINKYAHNLNKNDLKALGGPPDMLFVDCEGCLKDFFDTDIGKYVLKNVRFVINEMDGNNEYIDEELSKNRFVIIGEGYGCNETCPTIVWYRKPI